MTIFISLILGLIIFLSIPSYKVRVFCGSLNSGNPIYGICDRIANIHFSFKRNNYGGYTCVKMPSGDKEVYGKYIINFDSMKSLLAHHSFLYPMPQSQTTGFTPSFDAVPRENTQCRPETLARTYQSSDIYSIFANSSGNFMVDYILYSIPKTGECKTGFLSTPQGSCINLFRDYGSRHLNQDRY